jgi:hypothetical protein
MVRKQTQLICFAQLNSFLFLIFFFLLRTSFDSHQVIHEDCLAVPFLLVEVKSRAALAAVPTRSVQTGK